MLTMVLKTKPNALARLLRARTPCAGVGAALVMEDCGPLTYTDYTYQQLARPGGKRLVSHP
jgi:hypothetical protein